MKFPHSVTQNIGGKIVTPRARIGNRLLSIYPAIWSLILIMRKGRATEKCLDFDLRSAEGR